MAKAVLLWLLRRSRRELAVASGAAAGLLIVVAAVAVGVGHPSHRSSAPTHHAAPVLAFAPPQHDDDAGGSTYQPPASTAPTRTPPPPYGYAIEPPAPPLPPSCSAADLTSTLSTDQAAYRGGQSVFWTATVRNVSANACLGPATCNGIPVTMTGDNGWVSDGGPRVFGCTVPLGWHPPVLAPGQTLSQYGWWDQRKFVCFWCGGSGFAYAPSGSYTATADWGDGVHATSPRFTITVPACTASDVALSLSSDRGQYTGGELVRLTALVVQRPSSPITLPTCSLVESGSSPGFTASNGPLQVWQSCTACIPSTTWVLGPGVTVRAYAQWDQTTCASSRSGCTRAPSGTYEVTADWGSLGRVSQSIVLE